MRAFVLDNIKHGRPEFVAVSADEVVGWCDVLPSRPIYAQTGVLGMGLCHHSAARGSALT